MHGRENRTGCDRAQGLVGERATSRFGLDGVVQIDRDKASARGVSASDRGHPTAYGSRQVSTILPTNQ
jgi:hypothetical protein